MTLKAFVPKKKGKRKGSWLRIGVDGKVWWIGVNGCSRVVKEEVSGGPGPGGEGMDEEKVRCQLLRLNYMWKKDGRGENAFGNRGRSSLDFIECGLKERIGHFFVVAVAAYIRVAMIDCLAVGLVTNRYD